MEDAGVGGADTVDERGDGLRDIAVEDKTILAKVDVLDGPGGLAGNADGERGDAGCSAGLGGILAGGAAVGGRGDFEDRLRAAW